jgi:hypothetical protein
MAKPNKNNSEISKKDAKAFWDNLAKITKDIEEGNNREVREAEFKRMEQSYRVVHSISNGLF